MFSTWRYFSREQAKVIGGDIVPVRRQPIKLLLFSLFAVTFPLGDFSSANIQKADVIGGQPIILLSLCSCQQIQLVENRF
jgi:hypothetical protein